MLVRRAAQETTVDVGLCYSMCSPFSASHPHRLAQALLATEWYRRGNCGDAHELPDMKPRLLTSVSYQVIANVHLRVMASSGFIEQRQRHHCCRRKLLLARSYRACMSRGSRAIPLIKGSSAVCCNYPCSSICALVLLVSERPVEEEAGT